MKYTRKRSRRLNPPLLDFNEGGNGRKLLGAAAVGGALVWLAWPDAETGRVIYSRAECRAVAQVSLADCEGAYDTALASHEHIAPRFDSRFQCDQQFGTCYTDPHNAAFWIPPMAGVLVGYRERDDATGSGAGGYRHRYTGALPLYRERGGDFLNPHGNRVSAKSGIVRGKAGDTIAPNRAITISRSGFGSTSSARSSFGG